MQTKQLKYAAENKWHSDLFTNGENLTVKTPPGDFQVTIPETPLLSQQAVTSKRILSTLLTYSWTLTLIPNWTCSVVTVPLFDARLPKYVINQLHGSQYTTSITNWECCCLQSSSIHSNNEDQEDAWSQNPMVHIYSNFFTRMMN